jgi:hypothetical protein
MNTKTFYLVSQRAAIERINRKLANESRQLRTSRSARAKQDLGRYYIIDFYRNWIVRKNIDMEELARELDCLATWEKVAPE